MFKVKNNCPFWYDANCEDVVSDYKTTINIVSCLLERLFNWKNFYLEFMKEELLDDKRSLVFRCFFAGDSLIFKLFENLLIIYYKNEVYKFKCDWDHNYYYVLLTFYQKEIEGRIMTQQIQSHNLSLNITIGNMEYSFCLPYDIENYLNIDFFRLIKNNSSILDLKRIYQTCFFSKQSEYEKKLESIVAIFKIDSNGNKILLDKLVLIDGFVQTYLLSSIKNGIQFSLTGGLNQERKVIISNYCGQKNIDISSEIENIYTKSLKLNLN